MISVATVAKVLRDDYIATKQYGIDDLILEYAFLANEEAYSDMLWDMDDEDVLGDIRVLADDKDCWRRGLALVIFWHLEKLMASGYFLDD